MNDTNEIPEGVTGKSLFLIQGGEPVHMRYYTSPDSSYLGTYNLTWSDEVFYIGHDESVTYQNLATGELSIVEFNYYNDPSGIWESWGVLPSGDTLFKDRADGVLYLWQPRPVINPLLE